MNKNSKDGDNKAFIRKRRFIEQAMSAKSNNDLAQVKHDASNGIFVTASKDVSTLKQFKNLVLKCPAASLALDPSFRQTQCGFCAIRHETMLQCSTCKLIAVCPACVPKLSSDEHTKECPALKALGGTFGADIDSAHLLTVRLLCAQTNNVKWWKLFECLYQATDEGLDQDVISMICSHLPAPANNVEGYKKCLTRILGCSHNITDPSLPLGNQSLGRAIFLEHSFYNHSCKPNAFLSCQFVSNTLEASLHLIRTVKHGEPITISYIPLCGLSVQERQQRLGESYGFDCTCDVCTTTSSSSDNTQEQPKLSEDMDVQSIRDIQFSCNEQLTQGQEKEVEHVISLVRMTQRGICNQKIPPNHEVAIETERLLAMAYTLLEDWNESKLHHELFFQQAATIADIFDPVAMATQYLEYSKVLEASNESENANRAREKGMGILEMSLGHEHSWIRQLQSGNKEPADDGESRRDGKRQKILH